MNWLNVRFQDRQDREETFLLASSCFIWGILRSSEPIADDIVDKFKRIIRNSNLKINILIGLEGKCEVVTRL